MHTLRLIVVSLLLAAITVAAYWHLKDNYFIDIDDPVYVVANDQVRPGFTSAGIVWAFTTTDAANWHPLTWLSHMLDAELFGLDQRAHHLVNLFWHLANTLVLFLLLREMTGTLWRGALVAALFAVHPLHVESVAWVAERKDVLSTFFWMATSFAYVRFVRRRRPATYAVVIVLYALGLMAKPMVVTLPLVFLLLDFWPLGRGVLVPGRSPGLAPKAHDPVRFAPGIFREKIPLLALAVASSAVTLVAQTAGKMVKTLTFYPLTVRIENGLVSYVRYLGKTVWPLDLAFPYRHPGASLTLVQTGGAALVLMGVTAFAFRQRRRLPYLLTGWLWFVGTLVPVIGLIQVSHQAMADRYTYVPLIGLFIAFAWGLAVWSRTTPRGRVVVGTAAGLLLVPLLLLTRRQVGYWHDNMSLFEHTAGVTKGDNLAKVFLPGEMKKRPDAGKSMAGVEIVMGDDATYSRNMEKAFKHYEKSLDFDADQETAHTKMGSALLHLRKYDEAALHYAEVVKLRPDDAMARANLGLALKLRGMREEAVIQFQEALRLDPANGKALANMKDIQGQAAR